MYEVVAVIDLAQSQSQWKEIKESGKGKFYSTRRSN